MKYIIIIILFLTSCTYWTPQDYEWKSDFFKNRVVMEEVPAPPVEKNPPVCNQCICNMDLCI